jgi:hypothetical protein
MDDLGTIQKILIFTILGVFLIGGAGYFVYSQGEDVVTTRMTQAAPYQAENHVITPEADMKMISHTEYWSGETGKIAVRLVDNTGNPISVNNCTTSILYPGETAFVTDGLMTSSGFTGNHYYDFTVPTTEGVYEYSSTCNWGVNKAQTVASSFHVSPALNTQKVINATSATNNALLINLTTKAVAIYNDTQYIRSNMITQTSIDNAVAGINSSMNTQFTQLQTNISQLMSFCGNPQTSGSALCAYLSNINTSVAGIATNNAILSEINATTHTTYTYMTTTLFNKVNDVFGLATSINNTVTAVQATVNTINTTTTNTQNTVNTINGTVNGISADTQAILDRMNNATQMTISSG